MTQCRSRQACEIRAGASTPRTSRSSPALSDQPSNATLRPLPMTQPEVSAPRRHLPSRAVPHWAESLLVPPCSRRTHFLQRELGLVNEVAFTAGILHSE